MQQTIGSQLFGHWYDVAGWAIGAAVFAYFAVIGPRMPEPLKSMLPAFMQDRVTQVVFAALFAVAATGKLLRWW